MYNKHYYCVIMAGGIGSRFWPISRPALPKQFLDFNDSPNNFLRQTYDRFKKIIAPENIIVVTLSRYKELVQQTLPELPLPNILLEPYNRNTAPCITFASYVLKQRDPQAVMVATPSDHVIGNVAVFEKTIQEALEFAESSSKLVSIGIEPTRPDPDFGYIQLAKGYKWGQPSAVKTFTEKPDQQLAEVFVNSGEFLWNSGIFVWRADAICKELETHAPQITSLWDGWQSVCDTPEREQFLETVYSECPRLSIDYAVMEKTSEAMVFPTTFTWADIGNWNALYDYLADHDANGNAMNVNGKKLLRSSSGNIVYLGNKNKLVAMSDMQDYIVIDVKDVLLICPRDPEKLKSLLSELSVPEFKDYR